MKILNEIPKKMLIALATGAACTVAIVAGLIMVNGEEDYRMVQVYQIEGTAEVERQGKMMDAYDNMQLSSGDVLTTGSDSFVQLKLDEDKYILMEPDTKIRLEASGNSQDSKTSIYLEQGAIVNRIDNKLGENSSYQVSTPNSTMAVRGTTFRVEISYDAENAGQALLSVFDGQVQCNLILPDKSIDKNDVMVSKGTQILIWGDDKEVQYMDTESAEYEELKQEVLQFLHQAMENGHELSISEEEMALIMEVTEQLEGAKETPQPIATATPEPTEVPEPTEAPTESPVPTQLPTEVPTIAPVTTATPTTVPSPTVIPTATPKVLPTAIPVIEQVETSEEQPESVSGSETTAAPTAEPTAAPTAEPTAAPTAEPTAAPTAEPTAAPTAEPTAAPTAEPTAAPTAEPTAAPTAEPTALPTETPAAIPTATPGETSSPDASETSSPDASETSSPDETITPEANPTE